MERWHPEINIFHMSFGEMTITLDSVATLIGIPMVSRSVSSPVADDATSLLMRTLGVTRKAAQDELGLTRSRSVRLEWLRANFSNVTDVNTEARIKCTVRDYLLYLIGCALFSNKSGTTFLPRILDCLRTWVLFQHIHMGHNYTDIFV